MRTTYRAFRSTSTDVAAVRVSTAVVLKDGVSILQVYPSKMEYASLDAWKNAWSDCEFQTTDASVPSATSVKKSAPKRAKGPAGRREFEFAEFLLPEYRWLITAVTRLNDDTLEVTLNDTSKCKITRSLEFCEAPRVVREGIQLFDNESYSPALTSVRWLMMLLFVKPDTDTNDA